MPEPAQDRDAGAGTENRNGSGGMTELRKLIVGHDLERLDSVEARLDDPVRRTADVAQVLPQAVQGARPKSLREALEPVFEKSFQNSVRKHPKDLADAIYPII